MSRKPGWSPLEKIVSGGQTGVDRVALDAALAAGIPHGGWCPRGRRAEDGTVPDRYQLQETDSPQYAVRTRHNVCDSDGTLVLYRGRLLGGSQLTARVARELGKPLLTLDLAAGVDLESVRGWIARHGIRVLNVAGPRASSDPAVADLAAMLLRDLLGLRR